MALFFNCMLLYLIKLLVASAPEVLHKCYDSYIYELQIFCPSKNQYTELPTPIHN